MQRIIDADHMTKGNTVDSELDAFLRETGEKKLFLVCGGSIKKLEINEYFDSLEDRLGIKVVRFTDFQPNPKYESVVNGVRVLNEEGCRLIVAVGGGSAMDVAKCIKLYSNMDPSENYLDQFIVPNDRILVAVPTTAGSGSEATRFAVIYYEGKKQSVSDVSCIPSLIVLDSSLLEKLPEYQRKATMMDALCHATESFWSVNSTEESREYSSEAIQRILENQDGYLANTKAGNAGMLKAAHLAGKAINITQTTAGHAMCYQLTGRYGLAHGHAAALCVAELFPHMIHHTDKCIDPRGEKYLKDMLGKLAEAYGCDTPEMAAFRFQKLVEHLALETPKGNDNDFELLIHSVNPVRLKNHPIQLDEATIDRLYHRILMTDR